jgi:hypothetical protein
MDKTLLLRALVSGQDALLLLNGMILAKLEASQETRLPVHEFIQTGENRIEVLALETRSANNTSVLASANCSAQVWVELHKDRGPATQVEPHLLFVFEESHKRGQRLPKSRMLDVKVDLPVSFPRWRYLDVLQSLQAEKDLLNVQDFLLHILGLFQKKNASALSPYFTHRNREIASAYNLDLQQCHSTFTAFLNHLCTGCALEESALDPQGWHFRPVRNSAVYALLNQQHKPLFQFRCNQEQTSIHLPMHVGVLGGEVFVLR